MEGLPPSGTNFERSRPAFRIGPPAAPGRSANAKGFAALRPGAVERPALVKRLACKLLGVQAIREVSDHAREQNSPHLPDGSTNQLQPCPGAAHSRPVEIGRAMTLFAPTLHSAQDRASATPYILSFLVSFLAAAGGGKKCRSATCG